MDSARTGSKQTSYRVTFRRHWRLLSLPILLGVFAAAFFIAANHSSYKSIASLWVDTAPPAASSVGAGSATLATTPAAAEQTMLSELMSTQSFAVAVAEHSLLGASLGGSGAIQLKAASALTSQQVGSLAAGPQVLDLSYTASSAALATSTLKAIVNELIADSEGLNTAHDDASISYYTAQAATQSKILAADRAKVAAYLVDHPHATVQTDPNFSALMAAETAASQQLAQTNSALSQATGSQNSPGGWFVKILDQPSSARSVVMGKKKMLEVVIGGLFAGGLIAFLGVVALTPGRKREPWEDELFASDLLSEDRVADDPRKQLVPAGSKPSKALRFVGEEGLDFDPDSDID